MLWNDKMCDKTKFSKICLNFFLTLPPRETKQNEKWLLLKNSSWMLDISADTWQICGCRDYKWLRVQAVAEKHFQCRLCTGRREDCGSIGKRCAKLRMVHIFSDIETQTGCLQNSRTPSCLCVPQTKMKKSDLADSLDLECLCFDALLQSYVLNLQHLDWKHFQHMAEPAFGFLLLGQMLQEILFQVENIVRVRPMTILCRATWRDKMWWTEKNERATI